MKIFNLRTNCSEKKLNSTIKKKKKKKNIKKKKKKMSHFENNYEEFFKSPCKFYDDDVSIIEDYYKSIPEKLISDISIRSTRSSNQEKPEKKKLKKDNIKVFFL